MRKFNLSPLAFVMALAPAVPAMAELDPDKLWDLVGICEQAERAMSGGVPDEQAVLEIGGCFGFVHGFLATRRLHEPITEGKAGFCAPAPFKVSDVVLMFNAFLRKEPA